MSDEKTEQPTEKKLQDARRDGEVPFSRDIGMAASMICAVLAMQVSGGWLGAHLRALLHLALDMGNTGDYAATRRGMLLMGIEGAWLALPLILAIVAGPLCVGLLQTRFNLSFKKLEPKLDTLNPVNGTKRIFSARTLTDLVKMLVKAVAIGAVLWKGVESLMPLLLGTAYLPLLDIAQIGWNVLIRLFGVTCVVLLVVGGVDLGLQYWLFVRDHRMSKDEVKREHKDVEGNPEMKGQRKQFAHELLFADPRERLSKAKALVVNPTHYAAAIAYVQEFGVPQVVAKGEDAGALALREAALAQGLPIIANPPLARALYKVELDAAIPEELFSVVAAVLHWVDGLQAAPDAASPPSHDPGPSACN
ncbi:EscU/YscU/HrcU family type III secretion system export apparatus switch protein [Xanthomonas theicola]|uniref:Flagellar biosynthetic protein FlhB n=1 Tax=Xanthomonas theicola TaxID=56464 RepID=A0A2S6ZJI8_9XANT|nr:EscU/YscU/HrcU family type III secretion system export apparatus switch protein [Xanthomonas theicola]PPT92339.1 EscU/YscU/HrcU family type III secretion system export apparatus switch protein [Xanthomonas theicola]QNH23684.1 flagellar type III secretion system protein FlhB [Xanthomonas theicola]